jgi:hypothetical protein
MIHPMSWQPVLDGDLADQARAAVRAIADALGRLEPARRVLADDALFWAYAAGAFDDEPSARRFEAAIEALHERFAAPFASLGLYGGLAGAGWVIAHVSEDAGESLDEIDRALLRALEAPWPRGFDLIMGLTGAGVYFVERLRAGAETARPGIAHVIEQLAATAEAFPEGATWFTPPALLPAWQRATAPAGYYNVGVAHGTPGVIALFGAVVALGAAAPGDAALAAVAGQARELGERAVRWLRARALPPDPRGRFPATVTRESRESREPPRARTAWCYGDPGIAAALWSAAVRTGADPAEWRALALEAAARPAELCGASEPGLCHGAAGLAHLYNRCFQASGDERFRRAARDWFARALAMRRANEGIAGFTASLPRAPGIDETLVPQAAPDFLEGAAGVGLALLAALGGDEPGWDRLLLCDIPPRSP